MVLPLARPTGPRAHIGSWKGAPLHAHPDGDAPSVDFEDLWAILLELAAPDADPGLAMVHEPLPESAYWQAVTTRVEPSDAAALLATSGTARGGRGLVGCMGALAWPGPVASHELIAYREPRRRGTPRLVAQEPLQDLDSNGMFHTVDGGLACVPKTPCPVLAGLRAREPDALVEVALPALRQAAGEPLDGWCIWSTNQASGDHVLEAPPLQAPPWATLRTPATITGTPEARAGGHVHVPARSDSEFELVAFEPTGDFRHAVLALLPGDEVVATGGFDGNLRLESLRLIKAVDAPGPVPQCCGRSMKSHGKGAGYRCAACHASAERSGIPRAPGAWEVPIRARRHLHRPLDW